MIRLNYGLALLNQQQSDKGKQQLNLVLHSSDPLVAEQASQALQRANEHEKYEQSKSNNIEIAQDKPAFTREQLPPVDSQPKATEPEAPPKPVKMGYLQGTLVSVDCASAPAAVMTVSSGNKMWKMTVADTDHVVLIGADKFSCSWTQKKVAFNYAPSALNEGKVISLEIQ